MENVDEADKIRIEKNRIRTKYKSPHEKNKMHITNRKLVRSEDQLNFL
jgi:hypothetical protein